MWVLVLHGFVLVISAANNSFIGEVQWQYPSEAHTCRWELIPTRNNSPEPLPNVLVDPNDVIFQLYTLANPNSPQNLTPVGSYVGKFVASKPTKFVIHGWKNEADEMREIRDGWLQAGDYNVIVVDWSVYAGHWSYAQAKSAVLGVGKIVANFINWLASFGASTNDMQLAGYSLGAHVCGVAARYITAGRLSRITGMDPAFPLYSLEPIENRLDASDASFVQVIHTNGGLLGWKDPMGTADFYPNGGTFQPGCGIDIGYTCSHARSFYYFAESITTEIGFTAHQCGSWNDYMSGNCAGNPTALMGETTPTRNKEEDPSSDRNFTDFYVLPPAATSVSGTYYLATASYPPYALG